MTATEERVMGAPVHPRRRRDHGIGPTAPAARCRLARSAQSRWADDELPALDWVSDYYDLTYAETHKLGTAVMVFFAALDQ